MYVDQRNNFITRSPIVMGSVIFRLLIKYMWVNCNTTFMPWYNYGIKYM